MSSPQLDLTRSLMNVSGKLDRLADLLRPRPFKTYIDGALLSIAAATTPEKKESGTYEFATLIKEITICPNLYDAGDNVFFIINGNEYPSKNTPIYAQGYVIGDDTVPIPIKIEFDGELPVCPQDKPIEIVWTNGAATAKKVSIIFKRIVLKP